MVRFESDVDMANHCTFRVHAFADLFCSVGSEADILELIETPEWNIMNHIVLGGGANMLFTQDYHGLVVKNSILGKEIINETEEYVDIKVGAGEDRDSFVRRAVDHNRGGIENLIAIPGTVGASPVQNIGAYGVEAKDTIISVQGVNLNKKTSETLSSTQCEFNYRSSIFKNGLNGCFVVSFVVFRLRKVDASYKFITNYRDIEKGLQSLKEPLSVKVLANMIEEIRGQKLPDWHILGTAGSFFKNPVVSKTDYQKIQSGGKTQLVTFNLPDPDYVKLSAGQLIELAGFKGYRKDFAGVYEHHALILVNHGDAKGSDIAALAQAIQDKIQRMFGVALEPEVIYV